MPEKDHKTRLLCSTGKAYFYKCRSPKLKYIQDPADFVDNNYKNEYSQFLIPYDVMSVQISPIWGPYSGKEITLTYDWDNVKVTINAQELDSDVMLLQPGFSPDQFVRLAMAVSHGTTMCEICLPLQRFHQPLSLTTLCLQTAFHIQHSELQSEYLPKKLQSYFINSTNLKVNLQVWPKNSKRTHSYSINVPKDIIIAELCLIIKSLLKVNKQATIKLYQSFVPVEPQDVLSDGDDIHCVIVQDKEKKSGCWDTNSKQYILNKTGPKTFEIATKEVLVVSLIGKDTKELPIKLTDSLTTLDFAIREAFQLHSSTYLAFKHPREDRFRIKASKEIKSHNDLEKVKMLLQNKKRNFPCSGTTGIPVKQLYNNCPLYQKSLQCLGYYPGCYVEVFEVTGPSTPIMLFGKSIESHAIDVNLKWSLKVFLYYARLCTSSNVNFVSIDYINGNLKKKSVRDLLNVMGYLSPPSKSSWTDYIKIRS